MGVPRPQLPKLRASRAQKSSPTRETCSAWSPERTTISHLLSQHPDRGAINPPNPATAGLLSHRRSPSKVTPSTAHAPTPCPPDGPCLPLLPARAGSSTRWCPRGAVVIRDCCHSTPFAHHNRSEAGPGMLGAGGACRRRRHNHTGDKGDKADRKIRSGSMTVRLPRIPSVDETPPTHAVLRQNGTLTTQQRHERSISPSG